MAKQTSSGKPGRYFFLLYASFLFLVILPVLAIGTYAQRLSSRVLLEETKDLVNTALLYIRKNIDADFIQIERDLLPYDSNIHYQRVLNDETGSENVVYDTMVFQQELSRIVNTSRLLHSVIVYFPHSNRVVSNSTTSTLGLYYDRDMVLDAYSRALRDGSTDLVAATAHPSDKPIYSMVRTRPQGREIPKSVLLINIDYDRILETLLDLKYAEEIDLALLDPEGRILVSTADSDTQTTPDSDADVVSFTQQSIYKNWTYRASFSSAYFRDRTQPVRILIVSLSSVLILLGAVMSFFLSRTLYNPIRKIIDQLRPDFDEIQTRDELKLIDESLHRYLESNRHLSSLLRAHERTIQNSMFRRLLEGSYVPPDELEAGLSFIDFPQIWEQVIVVVLEVDGGLNDVADRRRFLLRLSIADIIERTARDRNLHVYTLLMQESRVHAVMVAESKTTELVNLARSVSITCRKKSHDELDVSLSIGIGAVENRLHMLSHSFEVAHRALQQKFMFGASKIYSATDVEMENGMVYIYPLQEMQRINHHLLGGDGRELIGAIGAMFQDFSDGGSQESEMVKAALIQLVSSTATLLIERGLSVDRLIEGERNITRDISLIDSVAHLEDYITDLYSSMVANIRTLRVRYSHVVRYVLDYIEQHYAESISLSDISGSLGMSKQYVSKRFKEEMGIKYVDYLNQHRLSTARDLLTKSNETVMKIGQRVGLANPQYFSKRFRERFGVTPAQYRSMQGVDQPD